MSSLVKFAGARLVHQMDLYNLEAGVSYRIAPSGMCLEFSGATPRAATGENKGKEINTLPGNARALLPIGRLRPIKYNALLEVHPLLYAMGEVNVPRIIEPGEEVEVVIRLRAYAECSPGELPWHVRLYLLD